MEHVELPALEGVQMETNWRGLVYNPENQFVVIIKNLHLDYSPASPLLLRNMVQ